MELNSAFWKWFGDSKVVDKHGNPLVVYHGTTHAFNKFITPAYFSSDKKISEHHSGERFEHLRQRSRVISVYLSIQNPYVVNDGWMPAEWPYDPKERRKLKDAGHDGIFWLDTENGDQLWIAFKPSQIKSATGNDGTWDADDADIRSNPKHKFNDYDIIINDNRKDTGAISVNLEMNGEQIDDAYAEIAIDSPSKIKSIVEESLIDPKSISEKSRKVAYLSGIELPRSLQSQGIGSFMIRSTIAYLSEIKIKSIYLVTENAPLVKYYKNFGFEVVNSNGYGQFLMRADIE